MIEVKIKNHQEFFYSTLENFVKNLEFTNKGEELIIEAIQYSLVDKNAKYIRSFIVFEVAQMLELFSFEDVTKLAIAIELMHTYSLVHDDLPGMDNSNFRRSKPSCHVKFTESTAILTGNAMQALAFEQVFAITNKELALKIFYEMSRVCGIYGILSGQVLDLNPALKSQTFDLMNYKKTGVLFQLCLTSVATLAGREDLKDSFLLYGKHFGYAYQMQDDLLDEDEDEVSYLTKFKNKQNLSDEIKLQVGFAKDAVKNLKNNTILIKLVDFLTNRLY